MEQYEKSIYSQQGEDGIIARIFEVIGTDTKFAVDIGAYDGRITSNVMALEDQGWTTLKIEGGEIADTEEAKRNGVKKHWVTVENVVELMQQYNVPEEFDFLSLDIDSIDYHVLKALLNNGYAPRALITEYNGSYGPVLPVITRYPIDPGKLWGDYYGASLPAFYYLLKEYGYRLIYCENEGVNAFWVRDDLATDGLPSLTPSQAYKPPQYGMKDKYGNFYGHEHRNTGIHDGWMQWVDLGLYKH